MPGGPAPIANMSATPNNDGSDDNNNQAATTGHNTQAKAINVSIKVSTAYKWADNLAKSKTLPKSLKGLLTTINSQPVLADNTVQFRPGKNSASMNWTRSANIEAFIMQGIGLAADDSCARCQRANGPFNGCRVFEGYGRGACANCYYNSDGTQCNLHASNVEAAGMYGKPFRVGYSD